MTFKPFSPHKYLFIMTLTISIEQFEKVDLFKPNTPQRQKHRFVSHAPYCPVARLNGPRAYIRTSLYVLVQGLKQLTNWLPAEKTPNVLDKKNYEISLLN